ncbi:MAG: hypothetical protein KIT02_11210 [Devosia sp.]|uniref:uridine kinase family protein n=1 Tax=Devosia sp. TaxID=1871048 RepID=UPI0024CB6A98|nr:shikimate kinase [Devosia sp.]UYN98520.1 MAG: hypothetical protein KIT02_11210 [Devosia sp.]
MGSTIETVVAAIEARSKGRDTPLVVAIDGRSGAGKSTLANIIARRIGACVVPGDDFFAGTTGISTATAADLAGTCIDWRRQRRVIESLLTTGRAQYQAFDWDAFDGSLQSDWTTLATSPVILVEGVYSARPELADLVDLSLLVHVSEARRIERLVAREGEIGPWERQWHRAEDHYFAMTRLPDSFDILLGDDEP